MLQTFYAYQAYYYLFNDTSLVKVGVLPNSYFTPTEQDEIYFNSKFGMDSVSKLITWVVATDGPNAPGSIQRKAYDSLLAYYKAKMNMTET